jgi:hypothetical protein
VFQSFSKGVTAVINRLIGFFLSQPRLLKPWGLPLTGLLLTGGLATNASMMETVALQQQAQAVDSSAVAKPQAVRVAAVAQVAVPKASIPDGTYLYGHSSEPEQIGKEYIVFEARQGKVIGAMYLPSSEYSCFYGTLDSKQMNLTVVNPYDQTAFSHSIARSQPAQIAAASGQINLENNYDSLTYPHSIGLEGYQPISQVSDNDRHILNDCVSNYQARVGN